MSIASGRLIQGGMEPRGNMYRVLLGTFLQMFQQWTGINLISRSTTSPLFTQDGNADLQSQQCTMARRSFKPSELTILSRPPLLRTSPMLYPSFYIIEKFGRRWLLIFGAALMLVCEFIIAIVGTVDSDSKAAMTYLSVFVCIYILGLAASWGSAV